MSDLTAPAYNPIPWDQSNHVPSKVEAKTRREDWFKVVIQGLVMHGGGFSGPLAYDVHRALDIADACIKAIDGTDYYQK